MPEKISRDVSMVGEMKIPVELLTRYKIEPRLVIRYPWIIGIAAPELLMDAKLREMLDKANVEVIIAPKVNM